MSSPSRGTGFGDGVRTGPQVNSRFDNGLPGAFSSPMFVYDIVPEPASFTNVAALQTPGAAGYVTLVNSGNSGTNTVELVNSQLFVRFDCNRRIQIRGVAGTTLAQLTIYGLYDNSLVTEQMNGPVGATTVISQKTYSGLFRIYTSAGTTQNISIGCADGFDLPYVATSRNYITPYFGGYLDNLSTPNASATIGQSTLVAGTVDVVCPAVTVDSLIFVSNNTQDGADTGFLTVPSATVIPGVGFTINSTDADDTSVINWRLENPTYMSGNATLVGIAGPGSAVTVLNDKISSTDILEVSRNTISGTQGNLSVTIVDGVSFTITSDQATDRSSLYYSIRKPSLYVGSATLVGGSVVVPSFVTTANSKIMVNLKTSGGTEGFLYISASTPGTSFTIGSTSGTDTSVVSYFIINPIQTGTYDLPDRTDPATISTGNPRGVYSPGQPADGQSHLTVSIYNRGVNNAAAAPGADPTDPDQYNNSVNLWGVDSYSDTTH